jgi:hypothetical protein
MKTSEDNRAGVQRIPRVPHTSPVFGERVAYLISYPSPMHSALRQVRGQMSPTPSKSDFLSFRRNGAQLIQAKVFASHINDRFTDHQRGSGRRRRHIQHMQHLTRGYELEIVH